MTCAEHYKIKLRSQRNRKILIENYKKQLSLYYKSGIEFDFRSAMDNMQRKGFTIDQLRNIEKEVLQED